MFNALYTVYCREAQYERFGGCYENVFIVEEYHFSVEILVFGPSEAKFQTDFLGAERSIFLLTLEGTLRLFR